MTENKNDKEMIQVSFLLDREKRRLLRIEAAKQNVTVSDLLRKATDKIITKSNDDK